jgi:hypothetical protein
MKLSVDDSKQQVVCYFHGTLRRTDLLGQNEVVLYGGSYLDESHLDEDLYLDESGWSVYIDKPEFQKPYIYYEDYIDGIDNYNDLPVETRDLIERKPIQNKLVMTW